jgi:hypothetical protein
MADHHCLGYVSQLIEQALDILKLGLMENDRCSVRFEYTKISSWSIIISVTVTTPLSCIQSLILALEFLMVCTMPKLSIDNPILLSFENIHQAIIIRVYGRNNAIMTY